MEIELRGRLEGMDPVPVCRGNDAQRAGRRATAGSAGSALGQAKQGLAPRTQRAVVGGGQRRDGPPDALAIERGTATDHRPTVVEIAFR